MVIQQNKARITDRREGLSIQDFLAKQKNNGNEQPALRDPRVVFAERQKAISDAREFSEVQELEDKSHLDELFEIAVPELNSQMRQVELVIEAMQDDIDELLKKVDDDISSVEDSAPIDNSIIFPFHRQYCFGLTRTGLATFTLWDGYITHGSNAVLTIAANTGITITSDNQYIGIEYDTTDGSVSLYSPSTVYPVSDGAVYRKAMYKFSFDGTVARTIRTGGGIIGGGQPIDIPSRFGDRN